MNDADIANEDVRILVERALLGKTVACFGEDGFGQHGRSDQPHHLTIEAIEVITTEKWPDAVTMTFTIEVFIAFPEDQYDGRKLCVLTDRNFEISFGKLLDAECIDRSSLIPNPHDKQELLERGVLFQVDLNKIF